MSDKFQGKLWAKIEVPNGEDWRTLSSDQKDNLVKGWLAEQMLSGLIDALDKTPINVEFSDEFGIDGCPKSFVYEAQLFIMSESGLDTFVKNLEKSVKANARLNQMLVNFKSKVVN